jgi:hypothetical protein
MHSSSQEADWVNGKVYASGKLIGFPGRQHGKKQAGPSLQLMCSKTFHLALGWLTQRSATAHLFQTKHLGLSYYLQLKQLP